MAPLLRLAAADRGGDGRRYLPAGSGYTEKPPNTMNKENLGLSSQDVSASRLSTEVPLDASRQLLSLDNSKASLGWSALAGRSVSPPPVIARAGAQAPYRGRPIVTTLIKAPPVWAPPPVLAAAPGSACITPSTLTPLPPGEPIATAPSERSGASTPRLDVSRRWVSPAPVIVRPPPPAMTQLEPGPPIVTAVQRTLSPSPSGVVRRPPTPIELATLFRRGSGSALLPSSGAVSPMYPLSPQHPLMPNNQRFRFYPDPDLDAAYEADGAKGGPPTWAPELPQMRGRPLTRALQEADRRDAEAAEHERRAERLSAQALAAAQAGRAAEASEDIEKQVKELLASQEAIREELRQIRDQVSSTHNDLEVFRSAWDQQPGSALSFPTPLPPPTLPLSRSRAAAPTASSSPGRESPVVIPRALDVQEPATHFSQIGGAGDPPPPPADFVAGPAPQVVAFRSPPSEAGRSIRSAGGVSTLGGGGGGRRPEVPSNLGYAKHGHLISSMGSRFAEHRARAHNALPSRAKQCCP